MSTLSANLLPTQTTKSQFFANFVGATPTATDYVVTFEVYAMGMRGQPATAVLLPAGMPAFATSVFSALGPAQNFFLLDGNVVHTFVLPQATYQAMLGQSFYIVVTSDFVKGSIAATTNTFVLNPPPVIRCDPEHNGLPALFSPYRTGRKVPDGPIKDKKTKDERGPHYDGTGSLPAELARVWAPLLVSGQVTEREKRIICAVSQNEGKRFDTVQSDDDQVLTVGIMQKTIAPDTDQGELGKQLYEFQQVEPDIVECLLGKAGWKLEYVGATPFECKVTYQGYGRKELRDKIREEFNNLPKGYKPAIHSAIVEPFVLLCRTPEFQDKQVRDTIDRLHKALATTPVGSQYKNFVVSDYLTTDFGWGLALDESINRPNALGTHFGAALDALRAASAAGPDPSAWGTDRPKFEKQLIQLYIEKRAIRIGNKPEVTKAKNRSDNLMHLLA